MDLRFSGFVADIAQAKGHAATAQGFSGFAAGEVGVLEVSHHIDVHLIVRC